MDARAVLKAGWNLDVEPIALAGEYDLNFLAGDHILKIMRTDYSRELIDLQIQCLRHLQVNSTLTPRVQPDVNGNDYCELQSANGDTRIAWLISRCDGLVYAQSKPHTLGLSQQIGAQVARLHKALADFDHPQLRRDIKWDLRAAPRLMRDAKNLDTHALADRFTNILAQHTLPAIEQLSDLPCQAIHNDLNDYNLLCASKPLGEPTLSGIIDFGDMIHAPRVCDIAIALTYLMLGKRYPLRHAFAFVEGYCSVSDLDEQEVALIWPLILTRLMMSAVNAQESAAAGYDADYLQISQAPVKALLDDIQSMDEQFIRSGFALAAKHASPAQRVNEWISAQREHFHDLFKTSLETAPILDLSVAGEHATDNPIAPSMDEIAASVAKLAGENDGPVLGRYAEPRLVYGSPAFLRGEHAAGDRRTVHIAIDVFLPALTNVHAPLAGTVHSAEVCDEDFDYGGLIVLRHEPEPGLVFFTLYGHLTHASASALRTGQAIAAGEAFAQLGQPSENGNWPPHVHFQLGLTDAPGSRWPGVVAIDELAVWREVFPDPAPLLGLANGHASGTIKQDQKLADTRAALTAANLKTSYAKPVAVARGWQATLFDEQGRGFLDAYNNVPHVGHSHPRIRAALNAQLRFVNTNSRYLQRVHTDYAQALTARFPAPLSVCFLLSSGSEANELALRLSRTYTGAKDTIVLASGYHGNTCAAISISDYKFSGPGGSGQADWVQVIDNPDTFRGQWREDVADAGERYASLVDSAITNVHAQKRQLASFIAETFPSVGGQLIPPAGYLQHVYKKIRAAGGLCIADEVQTGLGRLGEFFFGFEQQQVIPDIVVLGKPIGNGYPLAAVITTREIADRFANGMEYFATFGGASVACAVGHEVLRIIDEEQLAQRAHDVGGDLLEGLRALSQRFSLLADVRGMGLFIGVEIADQSRQPLTNVARYIVNRLREQRILIGSDGPDDNVLKIRPPLCFTKHDADYLLAHLEHILAEDALATYH